MVQNRTLSLAVLLFSAYLPSRALWAGDFSPLAKYSGILSLSNAEADGQADASQSPGYPSPNAPKTPPAIYTPYTTGQKFKHATRDTFGPIALLGVGVSAGLSQWSNTPSPWGQGAEGYAKRYASAFGVNMADEYFGATLNSILHEDPRYFPSKNRSTGGRIKHAVAYLFTTKTDDGGTSFAYARWGSALGAGFVANAWYPHTDNRVSDGLERAGIILAVDGGIHLAEEFIPFLRHLTP